MDAMVTTNGQVTIPKKVRDEMGLRPGSKVEFAVNQFGEIVMRKVGSVGKSGAPDRFDRLRGSVQIKWRTADLMEMLRS